MTTQTTSVRSPWLKIAAALGTLLAINAVPQTAQAYSWVDYNGSGYDWSYRPSNAFSGGSFYPGSYYHNSYNGYGGYNNYYTSQPTYVCRYNSLLGTIIGWVFGGRCHYGYSGREHTSNSFGWLTGVNRYSWSRPHTGYYGGYNPWAFPTNSDTSASTEAVTTTVCRAEVNGASMVGHVVDTNCHIGFQGLEFVESDFEVLSIQ